MIFLAVAVAAGIWEIESGANRADESLPKLGSTANTWRGDVHRFDRLREHVKRDSIVFAEPVENYFYQSANGQWLQARDLPCRVPKNFRGGFIIHGYGPNGPQATFSQRTLPLALREQMPTD